MLKIALSWRQVKKMQLPERDYDPELDCALPILVDLCTPLEDSGEFLLSGFGREPWPVDIRVDLCCLLEALPRALRAIEAGEEAVVDFYEQGMELQIRFLPDGEWYQACGESYGSRRLEPSIERIGRAELAAMLRAVRDEFMRALAEVAPALSVHPWLLAWLDGESVFSEDD